MLKLNLLENAHDSLKHVLEHAEPANKSAGDLKIIISGCAHVVELLFKEKLHRIHPAFIFSNIEDYPNDKRTITADKATKRLRSLAGIEFTKDEEKAIKTVRHKRNEIEHYEFSVSEQEGKAITGQILSFIFNFSEKHLELDWKDRYLQSNSTWAYQYVEFYDELISKAKAIIEEEEEVFTLECPSCHNDTFDVEKERCHVCGHEEEVLECSNNWCKKDYLFSSCEFDERVGICPKCEYEEGYAAANHEKY